MSTTHETAVQFFDTYAQALLDRDGEKLSQLYAVPALIAFPQQSIAVSDAAQTQQFFDQSWQQYEGVNDAQPAVEVIAATDHSIWADVTWSFDGQERERFVYQLLKGDKGWQVGVLTPLEVQDASR